MKNIFIPLAFLLLLLSGCRSNTDTIKISGEIKGLDNDTIYMYGNDEFSNFIITIPVTENKFSLTIPIDTLTLAMLFLNDQQEHPVYLDKGKNIQIKGDANLPYSFEVKGSRLNDEMTTFHKELAKIDSDSLLLQQIEEHIYKHQKSFINIYLLDKYFVQVDSPDTEKIKELISVMDGALQDHPHIAKLSTLIEDGDKATIEKVAPSFSITNTEGKRITRSEFRNKYVLMSFWASWCDSCQTTNKELKEVNKNYKKKVKKNKKNTPKDDKEKELAILGISLDLDKKSWKEAIEQDTLNWEQVCDFSGWNSSAIKLYGVNEIPYHILLDNRGKIIARGITGEELSKKLEEVLK